MPGRLLPLRLGNPWAARWATSARFASKVRSTFSVTLLSCMVYGPTLGRNCRDLTSLQWQKQLLCIEFQKVKWRDAGGNEHSMACLLMCGGSFLSSTPAFTMCMPSLSCTVSQTRLHVSISMCWQLQTYRAVWFIQTKALTTKRSVSSMICNSTARIVRFTGQCVTLTYQGCIHT